MTIGIGILAFDGMEELDFAGPWEVFGMANDVARKMGREPVYDIKLIAEELKMVTCAKGLQVMPNLSCAECSALDVLLIPGGIGARREATNQKLLDWIAEIAESARWVTSVCTGVLLLTAAGPARNKRVTTHWAFAETLREREEAAEVLDNFRYVRDGNLVTAAGVSAGIDMALWLTGEMHSAEFARAVQRAMQYEPAPPFAALT
jgi:transcriptional regulator GlxA family with amidase domain